MDSVIIYYHDNPLSVVAEQLITNEFCVIGYPFVESQNGNQTGTEVFVTRQSEGNFFKKKKKQKEKKIKKKQFKKTIQKMKKIKNEKNEKMKKCKK